MRILGMQVRLNLYLEGRSTGSNQHSWTGPASEEVTYILGRYYRTYEKGQHATYTVSRKGDKSRAKDLEPDIRTTNVIIRLLLTRSSLQPTSIRLSVSPSFEAVEGEARRGSQLVVSEPETTKEGGREGDRLNGGKGALLVLYILLFLCPPLSSLGGVGVDGGSLNRAEASDRPTVGGWKQQVERTDGESAFAETRASYIGSCGGRA